MTLTMIIAIIAAMLFGVFCALCLYSIFKNQKDIEKSENRMKDIEKKLGNMTDLINSKTDMLESKINEQPIYNVYSDMIDINPSYPYDTPAEGTESMINISDLLNDDFEDLLVDGSEEEMTKGSKAGGSLEDDEVLSAFMDSFKAFENEVIGGGTSVPDKRENTAEPVNKPAELTENPAKPVGIQQNELPEFDMDYSTPSEPEKVTIDVPVEMPDVPPTRQVEVPIDIPDEKKTETPVEIREKPVEIKEKPEIEKEIIFENPFRHHEGHDIGRSGKKYTASELKELIR